MAAVLRIALVPLVFAACGPVETTEQTEAPPLPNRIANPSVEEGSTAPAGWTFLADDGVEATGTWTREAADGARALQIDLEPGSGAGHARWWFDPVELTGGRFYEYAALQRSYGRGRLIWSCERGGERSFHSAWQSSSASSWERTAFRFFLPEDCAVTVMHVLDRPGFLQTDAHELREVAPAPLPRPIVSLAFDDGYASVRTVAAPALEARGMRGSFYVPSEWLGDENRLDADDVRALVDAGHEIGSHGATHRALPEVAVHELQDEIEGSLRQLERLGAAGGLAYPFGEFDEVVESFATTRARYVRTSLQGLNDATLDPARIRIHPVTADSTTASLLAAIDEARRTSTWLVLLFHDLGEPTAGAPYTTGTDQFVEVVDYLSIRGIAVLPVIEALAETGR